MSILYVMWVSLPFEFIGATRFYRAASGGRDGLSLGTGCELTENC